MTTLIPEPGDAIETIGHDVPLLATQIRHPGKTLVRTLFQLILAGAVAIPLLVAQLGPDAGTVPYLATVVVVCGVITRVMGTARVEAFLTQFVPWLAADPNAPVGVTLASEPKPHHQRIAATLVSPSKIKASDITTGTITTSKITDAGRALTDNADLTEVPVAPPAAEPEPKVDVQELVEEGKAEEAHPPAESDGGV